MDHDLLLVVGLGMLCLSVISLLSALVDERPPVVAAVVMTLGIALSVWGALGTQSSLAPADLPDLFFGVLGRYVL